MQQYVVYRHGWNEVSQNPQNGLPEKMAVARIDADSPEEACRLAQPQVLLLEGQYLSAEVAEVVDAKEEILNRKA
jgi:hypothetical protein